LKVNRTKIDENAKALSFITDAIVDKNASAVPLAYDQINFNIPGAEFIAQLTKTEDLIE